MYDILIFLISCTVVDFVSICKWIQSLIIEWYKKVRVAVHNGSQVLTIVLYRIVLSVLLYQIVAFKYCRCTVIVCLYALGVTEQVKQYAWQKNTLLKHSCTFFMLHMVRIVETSLISKHRFICLPHCVITLKLPRKAHGKFSTSTTTALCSRRLYQSFYSMSLPH